MTLRQLSRRPLANTWCWKSSARLMAQYAVRSFADMTRQTDDFFHYTSGRWLYNESKRLEERHLRFNVSALCKAAAASINRHEDEILSISKLAEGGFNRVFDITMQGGLQLIARLPYPSTQPKCLATASEVATMDLVRSYGIPTPTIYGYSTDANNAVGSEYILMEKVSGRCLADVWFDLSDSQRVKVLGEIVDQEVKLFNIPLPAYGSIFWERDVPRYVERARLGKQSGGLCVGPDVSFKHWFGERNQLDLQRGPATTPLRLLAGAAEKEVAWLHAYGKPRLPFDREYREMFNYEEVDPNEHIDALSNYLKVAAYLIPGEEWLHKPILRHPDLNPNNIFVDDDCKIVSIIDWQHSSVLPIFLHAGIPAFFQNYGDPDSEELKKPEFPDCDELDEDDRQKDIELYRRRHTHYYYVAATLMKLETHWKAMTYDRGLFRKKIYQHAAEPWEGSSIPLKADLVQLARGWPLSSSGTNVPCPIQFDQQEADDTIEKALAQEDMDRQMALLREVVGINADGWVSCEGYNSAVAQAAAMKQTALNGADDDLERDMIRKHWPFDDFDEDQ